MAAVLGYFAFEFYQYENTTFSKMTGYSYFDVWTNKKVRVAKNLLSTLEKVNGEQRLLLDLQIPSSEGNHHVDAIFLHESGLYIIDVKSMTGWISGREQDLEWIQSLHGDKQQVFENPIIVNQRTIYALQDILPDISSQVLQSLIIFTTECSFQKIELNSENIDVIKLPQLKNWAEQNLVGNALTAEDIKTIYTTLESMTQRKDVKLKNKGLSTN